MSIDAGGVRISAPDEETCWADLGGPAGQALPCNQPAENGVGLGLSISGEIVEEYYDGDLALLDSGPLPGATFRVTLRRRV